MSFVAKSPEPLYSKVFSYFLGESLGEVNYWVEQNKIPIGSLMPKEDYGDEEIPRSDIVTLSFDPISMPTTSRDAFNTLLLGGSGDGKTLLMKLCWSILHEAGYFCAYVDPKSTDSGRARMSWNSPRLPPNLVPKGIPLQHFVPGFSLNKEFEHMAHNFRHYSTRLTKLTEVEMWKGLGMTDVGANVVARLIKKYVDEGQQVTLSKLKHDLYNLPKEVLPIGSYDAIARVLTNIEYFKLISDKYRELNLLQEWQRGYSVCLSYNSAPITYSSFDIGLRIKESARMYFQGVRTPRMWFLDDSSYFAGDNPYSKSNFAVEEIKNIGFNYRSLGVYNFLAVQSLKIIDDKIAEGYKYKIISPMFYGVNNLSEINIPGKAIYYLKNDKLVKDRKNYTLQYLLVNENNDVIPFFPFTPGCNHFTEVYQAKTMEVAQ